MFLRMTLFYVWDYALCVFLRGAKKPDYSSNTCYKVASGSEVHVAAVTYWVCVSVCVCVRPKGPRIVS